MNEVLLFGIIIFGEFCAMMIGFAFAEAWVERKRIEKEMLDAKNRCLNAFQNECED
ncbi:MAG: hypothetical protein QXE06_06940 [Candidatus Bathyarchaeia archaeon]